MIVDALLIEGLAAETSGARALSRAGLVVQSLGGASRAADFGGNLRLPRASSQAQFCRGPALKMKTRRRLSSPPMSLGCESRSRLGAGNGFNVESNPAA